MVYLVGVGTIKRFYVLHRMTFAALWVTLGALDGTLELEAIASQLIRTKVKVLGGKLAAFKIQALPKGEGGLTQAKICWWI